MNSFFDIFAGQRTDVVSALSDFGKMIDDWAAGIGIPAFVFYAVGAVLALALGLLAYKIVKLLTGLAAGGFAFVFLGGLIYAFVLNAFSFQLNPIVRYAISGVLALVFFIIGFAKYKYIVFAVMAMVGYLVTAFYTAPYISGIVAPITGAIVFALLSALCLRVAFVIATSFVFGFMLTYMISCALPTVTILNMQENALALVIAAAVSVVMLVIQLLITRKQDKKEKKKSFGEFKDRREIITEY